MTSVEVPMTKTTLFYPIGIPDPPGVPSLTQVETAIEKLTAYLRDYFPNTRIGARHSHIGGEWNYNAVAEILDTDLKTASPEDTVIVYWAGHGLAGQGSHKLLLAKGQLLTRQLATWLLDCPARTVICILDCCWSGDGVADIMQEAEEIRRQLGSPAREDRTTTVIASARSEPSQEGAFIDAMLDVLTNGPGPQVGLAHRWDADTPKITPAELITAVGTRFDEAELDQQAFPVNLRHSDVGKFFPSIWHTRTRQLASRTVDDRCRALRQAEAALRKLGIPLPSTWTDSALEAHHAVVAKAAGLDEHDRAFLHEILGSLRLALSAEKLAWSLINRMTFTETALRSARRVVTKFDDSPIVRQFDLFHDMARTRGSESVLSPVEALIRFIARLAYECNADPTDPRLFEWAAQHGMETHEVNWILDQVREHSPIRRLVIDLVGNRLVDGELPDSASAQIFEDNVVVGDRADLDITPANVAGVLDAIATLVARKQHERFHQVDLIVPDSLILFDPAVVPVAKHHRSVELGARYPVSVRIGGRLNNNEDWSQLIDVYRILTKSPCDVRWIEDAPNDDLYDELMASPRAVVFGRVPGSLDQPPPEHLLDAVYASPIVVWPATEFGTRSKIGELVEEHWPNVPAVVANARWRRSGDSPVSAQLSQLRHVWEDDQWLTLASVMESYG
jgi:hypothetical protein